MSVASRGVGWLAALLWGAGVLAAPVDYGAIQDGIYDRMGEAAAAARTPTELQQVIDEKLTRPLIDLDRQRLRDIQRTQAQAGVNPGYVSGSPPTSGSFRPGGDVDAQLGTKEYYRYRDRLAREGYDVVDNGNSFTVRNHNATYHLEPNAYEPSFEPARRRALNADPEAAESVAYSRIKASVKDPRTGQIATGRAYLETPALTVGDYLKKNREALDMLERPGFQSRVEAINFTNKSVVKTLVELKNNGIDLGADVSRLSQTDIVKLIGNRRGAELDDFIRGMIKQNQTLLDRALTLSADQATRQMNGLLRQAERAAAAGNTAEAALLRAQYQNTRAALIEAANAGDNKYILEQVLGPKGKPPNVTAPPSRLSQVLTWGGRILAALSALEGSRREVEAAEIDQRDPSVLLAIGRSLAIFIGADRAWETGQGAAEANVEKNREAILAEIRAAQREGRDPDFTWLQLMSMVHGIEQYVGIKDVRDLVNATAEMVQAEWNMFDTETDQRAQQERIGAQLLAGLRGRAAELAALRGQLAEQRPETDRARALTDAAVVLGQQGAAQAGSLVARIGEAVAALSGLPALRTGPAPEDLAAIGQLAGQVCLPGQSEDAAARRLAELTERVAVLRRPAAANPGGGPDPRVAAEALLGEARAVHDRLALQSDSLREAEARLDDYAGLHDRASRLQAQILASARQMRPLYPRLSGELVDIETEVEAALPAAVPAGHADTGPVHEASDALRRAMGDLSAAVNGVRNMAAEQESELRQHLAAAEAQLERARDCLGGQDGGDAGEPCASDADCPIGYLCGDGRCRRDPRYEQAGGGGGDCWSDADCAAGQRCVRGACAEAGGRSGGGGEVLDLFGQRAQQREQEVGQRHAGQPPEAPGSGFGMSDIDGGMAVPPGDARRPPSGGSGGTGGTPSTPAPSRPPVTTTPAPPTTGSGEAGYYLLRGVGTYTSGRQNCTITFYAVAVVNSRAELQRDLRRLEQGLVSLPTGSSGTPVRVQSSGVMSGPSKTAPKLPVPRGYTIECR